EMTGWLTRARTARAASFYRSTRSAVRHDRPHAPVPRLRMRLLLSLSGLLLLSTLVSSGDTRRADVVANKKLGRGVNIGNALEAPREGDWGVRLKAEYFQAIKKAGFDTVRLPVKWSAHAKAAAPYTIDAKFAERVDWAIDQALANKLNVVVNVHHYDEMDR